MDYKNFDEWEREEARKFLKGYIIAFMLATLFWSLIFIIYCQSSNAFEHTGIDLPTIATIESSNNPLAYNKMSKAIGLYQITPIVLTEWNSFHPHEKYTGQDLFKPNVNEKIAKWYFYRIQQMLVYYKKPLTLENFLISYNAGISYVVHDKKLPSETINYIKKYERMVQK